MALLHLHHRAAYAHCAGLNRREKIRIRGISVERGMERGRELKQFCRRYGRKREFEYVVMIPTMDW